MFVNIDAAAVYFESKPKSTVREMSARTVPIRCSGSSNRRMAACFAVASNGEKLPLFLIFKGQTGRTIERNLNDILPDTVFGCCQSKGWMESRVMMIWVEKIWRPYLASFGNASLLLDDFACHKQAFFLAVMQELSTYVEPFPGGYT